MIEVRESQVRLIIYALGLAIRDSESSDVPEAKDDARKFRNLRHSLEDRLNSRNPCKPRKQEAKSDSSFE